MLKSQKAVYFFCMDPNQDMVAPLVFEASQALVDLKVMDWKVDGYPVLMYEDERGNILYYVRTKTVICMAHDRYLPVLDAYFSDCDLGVLINWHGGQNAPDPVICIHTIGDVMSQTFGPSEPKLSTNLARGLEQYRKEMGLDEFQVLTEATHWSGIMYGGEVEWILGSSVPFLDLEIGSTEESYTHSGAAMVIAKALKDLFVTDERYPVWLYCGGIHFEETLTAAVLHPESPIALTHVLPSRWIENEKYTGELGRKALMSCIDSIRGGIQGLVIHEKLKKEQRDLVEKLGEELGLPVIRRKMLRTR